MTDAALTKLVHEAMACHQSREFVRELKLWQRVLRARPHHDMWKHNVALALMNNGRLFEALEMFDELVSTAPHLSRVHNNRAVLLLRLGFPYRELAPAFAVALETSKDIAEYTRHLHNFCLSIAYGTDDAGSVAFDALERSFRETVRRISPKEFVESNESAFARMISAFRKVGAFRAAFAQKQWNSAEQLLEQAGAEFEALNLLNYKNIIGYSARCLALCRDTLAELERVGADSTLTPSMLLKRLNVLGETAHSLWTSENTSALNQLVNILGWFLVGARPVLEYLAQPRGNYKGDLEAQFQIRGLAEDYFVDIGRDLTTFLEFGNRQCGDLALEVDKAASQVIVRSRRDDAWRRLVLLMHGWTFNFANVSRTLAAEILGWPVSGADDAALELQKFKSFVERQAHRDVFVNAKPQENIARALLQSFLTSRSYREVPTRGGRTDVLSFHKDGRYLYEVKIWRGLEYYKQGLRELEEYIVGEGDDGELRGCFYVVFDPTKRQAARRQIGASYVETKICKAPAAIIVVNLSLETPSKRSA